MVNILLFFGFKPDIRNNNENGSFPQHGLVAAAGEIMGPSEFPQNKLQKLQQLVRILEALNLSGEDKSKKNRLGYTAFEEFTGFTKDKPSIENTISKSYREISTKIHNLLNPNPPPPPHPITHPSSAPDIQSICNVDYLIRQNYITSDNIGTSFFTIDGSTYYFSNEVNDICVKAYSAMIDAYTGYGKVGGSTRTFTFTVGLVITFACEINSFGKGTITATFNDGYSNKCNLELGPFAYIGP
jgi:hypothetical protein